MVPQERPPVAARAGAASVDALLLAVQRELQATTALVNLQLPAAQGSQLVVVGREAPRGLMLVSLIPNERHKKLIAGIHLGIMSYSTLFNWFIQGF